MGLIPLGTADWLAFESRGAVSLIFFGVVYDIHNSVHVIGTRIDLIIISALIFSAE